MKKHVLSLAVITLFTFVTAFTLAEPAKAISNNTVLADTQCFSPTAHCISGRFLEYWQQSGGLSVFGYPTTEPQMETNSSGDTVLTQWFERNRFELHPNNAAPYDVLLGLLGDQRLAQMGIDWGSQPKSTGPLKGCLWFDVTKHNVCDQGNGLGFKSYWQSHGLQFPGVSGITFAESLALFGLPLTEPRMETNSSGDTVLTQWFERARFEWHPDKPDQYKVLLGLLGNEVLANGQVKPPPPPPTLTNFYALSPDKSGVFRYNGTPNSWTQVGGPAAGLYAGGYGLFATNPNNGDIYQYQGTPNSWTKIGGPGSTFAVTNDAIYGLSPDKKGVFRYNGTPNSWTQVGGPAFTIIAK